MADLTIRPLSSVDDVRAAASLFDRIWGERRVVGAPLLRALAAHGGQVLGAFQNDEMVGAQVGLIGLGESGPLLHSHITGVAPEVQHQGVGFRLKLAQREWCLERGIDTVSWTFDPLVARNARFNLHKLGAVAVRFHRDYYGPMYDAFNRGDRSDRLEVHWELRTPRVEAACAGPVPERSGEVAVLLGEKDGWPEPQRGSGGPPLSVRVPLDYHGLREDEPAAAAAWRDAVADALETAFADGLRGGDFTRQGAYVLEPT
ncbi:MAG TPA: GNAT family N-acetyltransferase [Actinomycetota bacterium]|nr:GNAT family N-acetyltransferase [Actinomycetota bacterium]